MPLSRMLKVFVVALAISALYNFHSVVSAVSSLYAEPVDHSAAPPGNYTWTPERGLQPVTSDFPAIPPRR
jgi:hypothetical protein